MLGLWAGATGLACLPVPAAQPLAEKQARPAPEARPATVRVAGIVLKWIRTDKEANLRRIEPMIREAAAGGAKIVCTTECFLDGYAIADKSIPLDAYRALGEPIPGGTYYEKLAALARELRIHLVAGMLEADGEARFNTAVLISPEGKLIGKYRKQELGHERVRNTPGKESSVFQTPYGRVGILICADRTVPDIVRRFRENRAEFLLCPSGGMFGPRQNDPIVQARSRENNLPILFVHPAEFLVTGPDGSILQRTILGDVLLVGPREAGGAKDQKRVFYSDLPLPSKTNMTPPQTRKAESGKRKAESGKRKAESGKLRAES
jgi:predicted amidohydrolase